MTDSDDEMQDVSMVSDVNMASDYALPGALSFDSIVKVEDDDDSESFGTTLRSLQTPSENRDSPNTSLTSMSAASSTADTKPSDTPILVNDDLQKEGTSPFLYTKVAGKFRAKSSIPTRLPPAEYARQCVAAAEASRLNPYALHPSEHEYLRDKLCQLHVTVYLNIRNGILRLWVRNPNVAVSIEEAIGCTKDERWTRLACFAYEWLLRRGHINFGCVEPIGTVKSPRGKRREGTRKTIVVVGGGMAGLSTARQLTNLFHHHPDQAPPRIIVLEGRRRIGGRIYSHYLTSMQSSKLRPDQRATAEMGAHIVIGFEKGNPLDAIIRGQLALQSHTLRDLSTLYDVNGAPVNENHDVMMDRLYNDVLNRTEVYHVKVKVKKTAEGDKDLMDSGRDPPEEESLTIRQFEEATESGTIDQLLPMKAKASRRRGVGHKAAKLDNPSEEAEADMRSQTQLPAAEAAKNCGFLLRETTKMTDTLELDELAAKPHQSLGVLLNEGVRQYQQLLELRPFALRLLNWHFANAEYANAATVDELSLLNWDVDTPHAFEGDHAQVVGGYQQVPRALWRYPEVLDVRTNKAVQKITYGSPDDQGKATVFCEDGERIDADRVVFTAPLGVLKDQSIQFDPPLPNWKMGAISRLGFGLLNKLILVFERPFWDVEKDMFGLLRDRRSGSGLNQSDYKAGRGQFYLFWNCLETSGLPVLIALMAGEAAYEAERTSDQILVEQCMDQLRNIFGRENVPPPTESIVTRWKSDRFARGTYSFVAPEAQPVDFDLMAKPIDNLFFAGEATSSTHPATVHGAYLSGLRAAQEVFESLVGTIQIPPTLVPSKFKNKSVTVDLTLMDTHVAQAPKRKGDPIIPAGTFTRPVKEKNDLLKEAYDAAMWVRIYDDLGPPPIRPEKLNANAFLMFQGEHWNSVKERLQSARKGAPKKATKAERDMVRVELGKMWAALTEEQSAPYKAAAQKNRDGNDKALKEWQTKALEWDRRTWEVKDVWIKEGNSFEDFCKRQREDEDAIDAAMTGA